MDDAPIGVADGSQESRPPRRTGRLEDHQTCVTLPGPGGELSNLKLPPIQTPVANNYISPARVRIVFVSPLLT
jgi:hypothetical protein